MESDIVKRKIKIYIIGLQKNDPEIMPDSPVKYLKNDKCDQINRLFSTTFMYVLGYWFSQNGLGLWFGLSTVMMNKFVLLLLLFKMFIRFNHRTHTGIYLYTFIPILHCA